MSALRRLLWNPIISKEIHSRMRSVRTAMVIVVFLTTLSLAAYLAYRPFGGSSGGLDQATRISQAGATVFIATGATVLFFIGLTVPGLVGGAISGERERQTLDLLLCTPVRPSRIVIGKLVSSMLFVLLLIVAAVPIFATAFLLGGVGAAQLLVLVTLCVATAVLLGSLAMLCSVLMRRGSTAIVTAYGLAAGIALLPNIAPILSPPSTVSFQQGPVTSFTQPFPMASGRPVPPPVIPSPSVTTIRRGHIGIPWMVLASPATAAGLTLGAAELSHLSASCQISGTCTDTADLLADGPFAGWRIWEVFLLISSVISAVCLTASIAILRGSLVLTRRSRRPPPEPQPA